MGKKRSKTAKQLQNKATKKLAQSFAKKLGVSSSEQQRAAGVVAAAESKPRVYKKTKPAKTNKPAKQQQQGLKKLKNAMVRPSREVVDFQKAHASLQEREQVVEWKRHNNSRRAAATATTTTAPNNKKKPLEFAAPTFCFLHHQKTTNQLIQETTQIVQETKVFGQTAVNNNYAAPPMNTSSMTTDTFLNRWDGSMPVQPKKDDEGDEDLRHNPFAVLQPEEDETTTPTTAIPAAPAGLFSFAPPSFTLPTSSSVNEDFDPDL